MLNKRDTERRLRARAEAANEADSLDPESNAIEELPEPRRAPRRPWGWDSRSWFGMPRDFRRAHYSCCHIRVGPELTHDDP